MAERRHAARHDEEGAAPPDMSIPDDPAILTWTIEEDHEALAAPTLRDAFFTLCAALEAHLIEDNLTTYQHCREVQAWMVNAGEDASGKAQAVLAWRHAVMLLEEVLGQKLTPG